MLYFSTQLSLQDQTPCHPEKNYYSIALKGKKNFRYSDQMT